ncbi:sodium/proton-translocating pyrophosphatase [Clostridium sp. KNHs216]|uniref:sodium/proton-translocating pyrophosphatase n=1 Tax=Clostridium sp. KNHs216 TaxID=1550235 RepID=UPI0011506E89|nr:sodium/proton-translocating pyrophosphatase [Clostridium sp. KNHs216]TQI68603.1 hypothetical protein LY85_3344 [Clostridium sp. KNHs216]
MLYKNYVESVIASVAMIILAAVIAVVANLFLGNPLTFPSFFTTWASAFTINYLAALILPVGSWSARLCTFCKAKPGSFLQSLLNAVVITVVYNTIISAGMTLLNVGFTPAFWLAWAAICPVLFLPGILVTLIVSPFIVRFADKITGTKAAAGKEEENRMLR